MCANKNARRLKNSCSNNIKAMTLKTVLFYPGYVKLGSDIDHAVLCYKHCKTGNEGLSPKYMIDLFTHQNQIKQRLTRSSSHNNLYVPRSKLKKADQSVSIKGSKTWNELPLNIRKAPSLEIFKKKVYLHYLDVLDSNT